MFNEVEGLVQKFTTGEIDQGSVSQAASEQVNTMPHEEVAQHVQTAAQNAQQNGDPDMAQQLMQIVAQHGSDPQALKQDVVSLISSNPQVIQHFAPEFAQKILGAL
ncbi:MAG TPA: hypothetical protein VGG89_04475 [Candidatus Baltobacteraceae bacterium]|jgi:hypothetical protein